MAFIHKLKFLGFTIYPATVPQAVVDPADGEDVLQKLALKATHGYAGEETVKTLKEVETIKASHGYDTTPKTLKDVDDIAIQNEKFINDLLGYPDVFGFRYQIGQADDRVEAVNDVPYDTTGIAPEGSKRKKLLDKMRPYQCNHDGSQREYLQDDVRKKVGFTPSDLTNPLKLQMVRIPHFYYRSFQLEGWNYVLFCDLAPEQILTFTDPTQWKEINPCGYPRYRGKVENIGGINKLCSYAGVNPSVSTSLINFQTYAKNTNSKASVTPYFIYEAIALLMVLEFGRRNAQAFYTGVTNASSSFANAAVTGVTDVLDAPSGQVSVEWQPGSFTNQFRWRFIECVYGQIWNFLTGIYYAYDPVSTMNKVYITRDPEKINTNSNFSEHIYIGDTPSVNGYIKEFIPGSIVAGELGGSSTTYAADYNYTSASASTRVALAGGYSAYGAAAGPFFLSSNNAASDAYVSIGASLVIFD